MSEPANDERHRASPAARSPAAGAGRVILGGAPLGRPADVSASMRAALAATPVIAAEDTRRLRRLCADLDVTPTGRIVSFFEANETSRVPSLLEAVESGEDVLVVTDAGMPSISDPGYRLVVAAIDAGLRVTALPGPSAVTTAFALSGLPVDRYCFEGFLPRRHGERVRALAALAHERRTMVFFESPRRLAATLGDLASAFGADRRVAVCRELTKTYEEIRRGTIGELAEWAVDVRGEITVVVAGATATVDDADLAGAVAEREAAGESRKEAIAGVARVRGVPKRAVFDAVVAAKS
jgi:16S rRNA (cytidine1402-2'-O)-methyltransferase